MSSDQEQSVRGAGRRYVVDTTVGGVRRATRQGVVVKVLWTGAIVTGVAMTVFSIQALVSAHAVRQLGSVSRVDNSRSQEFPAVTVCDVSQLTSNPASFNTGDSYRLQASRKRRQALHDAYDDRLAYQTELDTLSQDQLKATGRPLHEFLLACRLGDYVCDTRNFTQFYDHNLGYCYTFIAEQPHLNTWRTGPDNGLTLDLNTIDSPEWSMERKSGFVVMAHKAGNTIFAAEEGLYVPPMHAAYLAIIKSVATGRSDSDCVDISEEAENADPDSDIFVVDKGWRYSHRACQRTCLQRSLVTQCSCCDVSLPCPSDVLGYDNTVVQSRVAAPRCDLTNMDQGKCVRGVVRQYSSGELNCLSHCKVRCRTTTYPTRFSLTDWSGRLFSMIQGSQVGATSAATTIAERSTNATTASSMPYSNQSKTGQAQIMRIPVRTENPLPPELIPETTPTEANTDLLVNEGSGDLPTTTPTAGQFSPQDSEVVTDVRIQVYFEDLRARITEPVTTNQWVELMADIGGVASLWLGLSVLGVLEVVHMLVELCILGFTKCCGKGSVTPVKPFEDSA